MPTLRKSNDSRLEDRMSAKENQLLQDTTPAPGTPARRRWSTFEKVASSLLGALASLVGILSYLGVNILPESAQPDPPTSTTAPITVDGVSFDLLGCKRDRPPEVHCSLRVSTVKPSSLAINRASTTLVDSRNRNYRPSYVQIGSEKGETARCPQEIGLPVEGRIVFEGVEPDAELQILRVGFKPEGYIDFKKPQALQP